MNRLWESLVVGLCGSLLTLAHSRATLWGVLTDLQIEASYRSDRHQVLRSFHIPCLEQSSRYDRAAGYFTSDSLSVAASGLSRLIQREGRMRLVASPFLNEEDGQAIREGYEKREIIERSLVRELTRDDIPDPVGERLGFLAWMVAEGLLDVRIALVENEQGIGIYHEKFGIYKDSAGNFVAFSGSANETVGGLINNFETVDVFRSWIEADAKRANSRVYDFDMLWKGDTKGLQIYDFPKAARQKLLEYRPRQRPLFEPEEEALLSDNEGIPRLPKDFSLRTYQISAIEKWFSSNGNGIWEMATGTGKTPTALSAIVKAWKHIQPHSLLVSIVCPFKDLVEQWGREVKKFGINPILCYDSQKNWLQDLGNSIASLGASELPIVSISTNASFAGKAYQEIVSQVTSPIMFIADEVHNFGSRQLRDLLPGKARYRLGLSATPIRHRDKAGTDALFHYFGNVVFKYSLTQAISDGFLTPYKYYPIITHLSGEELSEYIDITIRIGKIIGITNKEYWIDEIDEGPLKMYLFRRARILGRAQSKIVMLEKTLSRLTDSTHNLVYCSDASLLGEEENPTRHIDAVTKIIGKNLKMRVNSYTHLTPPEERGILRHMLASGEIQVLTAIRCLDEGIDIPEVRRGFILASSTNPRQFIQRRGRLLRLSAGKNRADLFDFIVIPPKGELDDSVFGIERRLVGREMQRVIRFAREAQNGDLALNRLLEIRKQYNLLDLS